MVIASAHDEARGTGRIQDALSAARHARRPALVAYLTGGFPDPVAFGQHLAMLTTDRSHIDHNFTIWMTS